jgi:hypothetical protein
MNFNAKIHFQNIPEEVVEEIYKTLPDGTIIKVANSHEDSDMHVEVSSPARGEEVEYLSKSGQFDSAIIL